jgi:hypothetical protein
MIRALLLILIFMLLATPAHAVSSVAHAEYTLLDSPASQLDRCYRRCEKNNPPAPSPQPTHSPDAPLQLAFLQTHLHRNVPRRRPPVYPRSLRH